MKILKTKYYVSKETLLGVGLTVGGMGLGLVTATNTYLTSKKNSESGDKRINKLREKLLRDFKKEYGENNIAQADGFNNAAAVSFNEKFIRKIKTDEGFRKKVEELADKRPEIKAALYIISKGDPTKPAIIYDTNFYDPATLSHEIGHTRYQDPEKDTSEIIKLAHKSPSITNLDDFDGLIIAPTLGLASGVAHGVSNGSGKIKNGLIALTGLDTCVLLVKELAASRKGLELLREVGATENEIKEFRNYLLSAAGSYLSNGLTLIGLEILGAKTGKWVVNKLKNMIK